MPAVRAEDRLALDPALLGALSRLTRPVLADRLSLGFRLPEPPPLNSVSAFRFSGNTQPVLLRSKAEWPFRPQECRSVFHVESERRKRNSLKYSKVIHRELQRTGKGSDMSFHKIAPVKKAPKPVPGPKKKAPKKHAPKRRPIAHKG
jgi:hypothetical protein